MPLPTALLKTYLVYYKALKILNKARENRRCIKNEISAHLPEGGKTCNHDQETGMIFFRVFHSSVHAAKVPAPSLALLLFKKCLSDPTKWYNMSFSDLCFLEHNVSSLITKFIGNPDTT